MNTKNWFVYDSLGSEAHYFATEKEALEVATEVIEDCRDDLQLEFNSHYKYYDDILNKIYGEK